MTSHFSRSSQPLPGVRELFPGPYSSTFTLSPYRLLTCNSDLFHPRPGMPTLSNPSPLSPIHDPLRRTDYDVSFISYHIYFLLTLLQVTNPQFQITRHFQSSSIPSTARDTASSTTTDHSHPYTRDLPIPPHVPPHTTHPPTTLQWPNNNPAPSRSPSPEFSPLHRVGPSSLPDNERSSSPITPSPHDPSTELPSQSTSFEQNPLESHSGKKRHKCNICGSRWGRPSSLKIHMVSHTGVKGANLFSFVFSLSQSS
jgi:hypothetical protein